MTERVVVCGALNSPGSGAVSGEPVLATEPVVGCGSAAGPVAEAVTDRGSVRGPVDRGSVRGPVVAGCGPVAGPRVVAGPSVGPSR